MNRSPTRTPLRLALPLGVLLGAGGPAPAQPATAPLPAPPAAAPPAAAPPAAAPPAAAPPAAVPLPQTKPAAPANVPVAPSAASLADPLTAPAAGAVARLAHAELRLIGDPSPRDFIVASYLLGLAHDLAPRDEEILRHAADAADAAGEADRAAARLKELLRLAPTDSLVQFRLIGMQVARLQNADDRLDAYANFLGPRGAALDPSVRSRLALDAALLLRERGDLKGFGDRLSTAVELDHTNKRAALLALQFFSDQVDDPQGRLTLLLAVLEADPLDREVHLAVARELAGAGAYEAANRSFQNYSRVSSAAGARAPEAIIAEQQSILWALEGEKKTIGEMRKQVEKEREQIKAAIAAQVAAGKAAGALPDPESIRVPFDICRVILAAAAAEEDEENAAFAVAELVGVTARDIRDAEPGRSPDRPDTPEARAEWERAARRLRAEVLWMRLLAGRDTEEAARGVEALRADPAVNPQRLARFEGFLALRKGDADRARVLLEPLASPRGGDPYAALGLAAVAEARDGREGAVALYAAVARSEAGTLAGYYARARAAKLSDGKPPAPAPIAGAMAAAADSIGPWLDAMTAEGARGFSSLQIDLVRTQGGPGESIEARVKLRNTGPVALGLSDTGPLNARLALLPRVEAGLERVPTAALVEVFDLRRRLRLLPQESVEATVRLDLGMLGFFLDEIAGRTARIRWRGVQGFQMNEQGGVDTPYYSLSTETESYVRSPVGAAASSDDALLKAVESGPDADLPGSLAGLRWRLSPPASHLAPGRDLAPEVSDKLGAALARRFARSGRAAKLLILALIPPSGSLPALKPLDDAAREAPERDVLALVIATRVADPADPILRSAEASPEPAFAALGRAVRERLTDGARSYATTPHADLIPVGEAPAVPPAPAVRP